MKYFITLIITILLFCNTYSQCSYCLSLKEASRNPNEVTKLNLNNSSIFTLDSTLNQFQQLREIDLSFSFFRNFDNSIYNPNLTILNLSNTIVNPWELEQIPKSFPNLQVLDLSATQLRFLPNRMGNFEQLKQLDLSKNKLTYLPQELEKFQQLTHLNLSNNKIQLLSTALAFLWKLEQLDLSDNPKLDLTKIFTSIAENKNFKELSIDGKSLDKSSCKILKTLTIKFLKINEVDDEKLKYVYNIPTLTKLDIHRYTGNDLGNLKSKFTNLSHLVLRNSFLSKELLTGIKIDTLTLINIDNGSVLRCNGAKHIKVLDLSQCNLSKEELTQLKQQLPKTIILSNHIADYNYEITNNVSPIVAIPSKNILHSSHTSTTVEEKNARIEIPENAFLTERGTVYNGNVIIDLKVYEDALELALDGAPMNYYTNGNTELFGSNGMLRFNATAENGEQLYPNSDALIQVEMRNNLPQTLGLMYRFDETEKNWVELPNQATSTNNGIDLQRIVDSINAIDARNLVQVVSIDRKYSLKLKTKKYELPLLDFDSRFYPKKNAKKNRFMYFNRSSEVGKTLCKYTWVIDTLISQKTESYLKQLQKETRYKKKELKNKNRTFLPKIIWDISITPDYFNDNYRLHFKSRDTVISLPIAMQLGTNTKTQREHQKFQKNLGKAEKKDARLKVSFDKFYEKNVAKYAQTVREQLIQNIIANISSNRGNTELIQFGLTSFGLINCDIIIRFPPEDFLVLGSQIHDQNGNSYPTPAEVRVLLKAQNTYMVAKSKKIPLYNASVIFIQLSKNKLAIIPNNFKELAANKVSVIDIKNLTSSEISKILLASP